MLTAGIAGSYAAGIDRLLAAGATLVGYVPQPGAGTAVSAVVLTADAALLAPGSALLEECFGPVIIVAEYDDAAHRDAVLAGLQGCLVGCVMTDGPDDPQTVGAVTALSAIAGRVVVDGWPTGVATTWAQHHSGPWPSTSAPAATSVGSAALDRYTRPVAQQGVPANLLPPALVDANPWRLPRRVDGVLEPAPKQAAASALKDPASPASKQAAGAATRTAAS